MIAATITLTVAQQVSPVRHCSYLPPIEQSPSGGAMLLGEDHATGSK